jgi:hypothetical protein
MNTRSQGGTYLTQKSACLPMKRFAHKTRRMMGDGTRIGLAELYITLICGM